ncbi:MAG: MtnX-like HAD-IB family phosphatase [Firmicutes bacterium]|nr:MtnX-like HAD-IB family phosphatase [Bacillota bacterium]
MQVSKRSEYAILSAIYLAKSKRFCDINEIAGSQKLPVSFAAKTLQALVRVGILISKRGVGGGFCLARPAAEISLLELVEAVDGAMAISSCLKDNSSFSPNNRLLRSIWGRVQGAIISELSGMTLADIIAGDTSNGKSTHKRPVILCDFDGTISRKDVSDTIFTLWLGDKWSEIDQEWHDGKISMVGLYKKCWSLVSASEEELQSFVDSIDIDLYFSEFVRKVRESDISIYLVSDGFDYFIERIMGRYGLADIKYYANGLSFVNGKPKLAFRNQHPECIQCANCKKFVIDEKRRDVEFVIYIGNGLSDRCAARHADLVFAKDSLLKYCKDEGIAYVPYENFGEIIKYLHGQGVLSGELSAFSLKKKAIKSY